MTDFAIAIDANGGYDLDLVDGDLVLTHTISRAREVSQRVIYRVCTWLGQSPYDVRAGVPYEQVVFGFEPVPGVAGLLQAEIADTEGVDEFADEPTFELDGRTLTIYAPIRIGAEDVPITVEITP